MKAMKTVRLDLTADGRLDILDRVKSYRGGLRSITALLSYLS